MLVVAVALIGASGMTSCASNSKGADVSARGAGTTAGEEVACGPQEPWQKISRDGTPSDRDPTTAQAAVDQFLKLADTYGIPEAERRDIGPDPSDKTGNTFTNPAHRIRIDLTELRGHWFVEGLTFCTGATASQLFDPVDGSAEPFSSPESGEPTSSFSQLEEKSLLGRLR